MPELEKCCDTCYENHRGCSCLQSSKCLENDFSEWEPYTNGDMIRQMDDADLAEFLCDCFDCRPQSCPAAEQCWIGHIGLIYWLKERASSKDGI